MLLLLASVSLSFLFVYSHVKMAPKKTAGRRKPDQKKPDVEEREEEHSLALLPQVGACFREVHLSAAGIPKQTKALMKLWRSSPEALATAVSSVLLLVLKDTPQLPNDALRRHYHFLEALTKAALAQPPAATEQVEKDSVAIRCIEAVVSFHNANDKHIRLGVVTSIEVLLKAVDQENTGDERQGLYQRLAEALKYRVHDKCPHVRERAVAAVAAFQTGKRDCDVTQQLLALLCTDSSSGVRQQILHSIIAKKEFLEGYFHGLVRCTRDVVAKVRCEAWDGFSRFPWRYITAYAAAKNVPFAQLLYEGLTDDNSSVRIASRSALVNAWLHRDCKADCEALLEPIVTGFSFDSLDPYTTLSDTLFESCAHSQPRRRFSIVLEDVSVSSLLMWRADCKATSQRIPAEDEDVDEPGGGMLLPLDKFSYLLQDAVQCYTRGEEAHLRVAHFRSTDDADNVLRIILSMFDTYHEDGYLAHADNTTRQRLLKILGFLLKVVPDDDPALFVEASLRALMPLSTRTPEEVASTVTGSLDSLFRSLSLPQKHHLAFEDVEAFGAKSRERQQELLRLRVLAGSGKENESAYEELKAETKRDEKFLIRILHIAWAFFSNSQRGDHLPTFCTHVIQLGRQSASEAVQVIAMKTLGLQCLIRPESVHTFMPIILADASLNTRGEDDSLAIAAIGVVIDLCMEFGFRFFSTNVATKVVTPSDSRSTATPYKQEEDDDDEEGRHSITDRREREHAVMAEDVHKVGSSHLQHALLSYLSPTCRATSTILVVGCCKLLSAHRIPRERTPLFTALLLLHMCQFEQEKQTQRRSAYAASLLQQFFRSYASSHGQRQSEVVRGGLMAIQLLLNHGAPHTVTGRLIGFILNVSDAFLLASVRELDPHVAPPIDVTEDASTDGTTTSRSTAPSLRGSTNLSTRSSAARSSLQAGRLLRELHQHSLHERVAEHLLFMLLTLCDTVSPPVWDVCLSAIEKRMYFYSKDPQPFLQRLAATIIGHPHTSADTRDRLELWIKEVSARSPPSVMMDAAAFAARCTHMQEESEHLQDELERYGGARFEMLLQSESLPCSPVSPADGVKHEGRALAALAGKKRPRDDRSALGVDAIIGKR